MVYGDELPEAVWDAIRRVARDEAQREDTVLSDQIAGMETSIAQWMGSVERWIEESKEDREKIRETLERYTQTQVQLVDFLFGEATPNIDGHVVRDGGFKKVVEEVVAKVNSNGGFKVQIPWGKVAAMLTAIGGVLTAFAQFLASM